ncbi:hypothetical protein BDQ17DRAFT_1393026 [Cyathus striatus]|nr:hypothetical protein BDQ17DRAFT_1393026 [Cyathus striatus]
MSPTQHLLPSSSFSRHSNHPCSTSFLPPPPLPPKYNQLTDLQSSYDYIIAGGGLAGLVMASRLSEDSNISVLVLEAGGTADDDRGRIDTPSGAFYNSIVGTQYDWAHETVPQVNLSNRVVGGLEGRYVLGGSSAMNAMYLVRPSSAEFDAWAEMLDGFEDDESGVNASTYNWQNMFTTMRKSETFSAPLPDPERIANIHYDAGNYGTDGPMHVSYPAIQISVTGNWTSTLESIGVPEQTTPNGGNNLGGYITTSSINPTNWTRSFSRSAYIDPLPPRSNLHILPNALVTRIVFSDTRDSEGDAIATGVEYAVSEEAPRQIVNVNREVVVAGGATGSPKILMLSGVGPRDVLESLGLEVVEELAGVGQHLQDHLPSMQADISSAFNDSVTLVPSQYSEVQEGYKAIYQVNMEKFLSDVPQLELLLNVVGPNVVGIQAASQHPYSTGRVYINSTNPFDQIIVDPQYFSHHADVVLLRQGMRVARNLGAAFQALNLFGAELSPGTTVQTDEDWENWLRNSGAGTQYHPTASCVMLPRSLGGVVDKRMKVHGLENVRIVDASVYPFEFAAHLASATYGLAELGAQLIKDNPIIASASLATSDARTSSAGLAVWGTVVCVLLQLLFYL